MPDIDERIYRTNPRDKVLVFGLHSGEEPAALAQFVEQTGVSFPILHDRDTLYHLSFPEGVGYPYPRDVVIGPDLKIRAIRNSFNPDELQDMIDALLAE